MCSERGIEGDGALLVQHRSGAVVDGGRSHQTDTAVAVIVVVPVEELLAVSPSVLIEPKRSGKSGRYFRVLNCASEYGLSSDTCGRLCVLATSRSMRSAATGFDRMLVPRSAWSVRVPGAMFSFSRVSAMSCSASSADSRCAISQPTT